MAFFNFWVYLSIFFILLRFEPFRQIVQNIRSLVWNWFCDSAGDFCKRNEDKLSNLIRLINENFLKGMGVCKKFAKSIKSGNGLSKAKVDKKDGKMHVDCMIEGEKHCIILPYSAKLALRGQEYEVIDRDGSSRKLNNFHPGVQMTVVESDDENGISKMGIIFTPKMFDGVKFVKSEK